MDKRHSSPSSRNRSPRPGPYRKRSNSFPISEALGCSTPEAELILAEGRAALRTRLADRQRGRSRKNGTQTFNPKDHIAYLAQRPVVSEAADKDSSALARPNPPRHARIPSDATDRSTSTVIAPNQHIEIPSRDAADDLNRASSPLGDYSAQLAKFIQSQLNSIPAYTSGSSSLSPQSCPDLSFARSGPPLKSPSLPAKRVSMKRHVGAPSLIQIPSIRPPERSAFSEWSSTDDETDDEADYEAPPVPDTEIAQPAPKNGSYTPSVLRYYEQSSGSTFLFTSTPISDGEAEPYTAKGFSLESMQATLGTHGDSPSSTHDDSPSSDSRLSIISSSSAPSLTSNSTASYFEGKMPLSQVPDLKDRILAAVTPPASKVIPAISPFEGADLASVHDILVQSQRSVLVDGMSFDLVRDFTAPGEGIRRHQARC